MTEKTYTATLTEGEVGLLRELLLDEIDNQDDNLREADGSDIGLFQERVDSCNSMLEKFKDAPLPTDDGATRA